MGSHEKVLGTAISLLSVYHDREKKIREAILRKGKAKKKKLFRRKKTFPTSTRSY